MRVGSKRHARTWFNMPVEIGACVGVHGLRIREDTQYLRNKKERITVRDDGIVQTITVSKDGCSSRIESNVDVWEWLTADGGGW